MLRQKGRLLKKDKEQSLNYIQVEEFPWNSLKEVDIITADNLKKNILHVKYHSKKELSKKVLPLSKFNEKFTPKTTPLYPIDLTDDYLKTQENISTRKKNQNLRQEDNINLKDLNLLAESKLSNNSWKEEKSQTVPRENTTKLPLTKEESQREESEDRKKTQEKTLADDTKDSKKGDKKEEPKPTVKNSSPDNQSFSQEKKEAFQESTSKEEDIKSKIKLKNLENKKNFNSNLPDDNKVSLQNKVSSEQSIETNKNTSSKNNQSRREEPTDRTLKEEEISHAENKNNLIEDKSKTVTENHNLELSPLQAEKPKFDEKYLNKLDDSLKNIEKAHKELNQNAQDVFMEILKISSEKILREQIKLSDNYLKNCFKSLSDEFKKETLQIEISHMDSERFKRVIDESNILKNVKIIENPSIEEGDFRIETKNKLSVFNLKKVIESLFNDIKKHLNLEETTTEEK